MFTLFNTLLQRFNPVARVSEPPATPAPVKSAAQTEPPVPQPDAGDMTPKPEPDPRKELEKESFTLAFNEARRSWELEPNETMLKALEARGVAMAMALYRPRSEAKDQRAAEKLKAKEAQIGKRSAARARAWAAWQARRQEEANLGPSEPCPSAEGCLIHAATFALAISIAPTLHDLFVGLDPFLKWLAGGSSALGISYLIIHGIMPATPQIDNEED